MTISAPVLGLLVGNFAFSLGPHLLSVSLAAILFARTGSAFLSSLVVVFSFLPAALGQRYFVLWLSRSHLKRFAISNCAFTVIASFLCAECIRREFPLWTLYVILFLRAIGNVNARKAFEKWMKEISPPAVQEFRFKLLTAGFLFATLASGTFVWTLLHTESLYAVATAHLGVFVLGTAVLWLMAPAPTAAKGALTQKEESFRMGETISEILGNDALRGDFLLTTFTSGLFQGAYTCLLAVLPLGQFGLSLPTVGLFQIAASLGILLGFFVVTFGGNAVRDRHGLFPVKTTLLLLVGALSIGLCATSSSTASALVGFLVVNTVFECIWLQRSSGFMSKVSKTRFARYASALSFLMTVYFVLSVLAYSASIDLWGVAGGTLIFLSLQLLCALVATNNLFIKPHFNRYLELQKKEALTKLATQVAHDIRSPVALLKMIVGKGEQFPAEEKRVLLGCVEAIDTVAGRLLAEHRGGLSAALTAQAVLPVVETAMEAKRREFAGRGEIKFCLTTSEGVDAVRAAIDSTELRRVLSNLFNNSIESLVDSRGFVNVSVSAKGQELCITVADSGKGIPVSVLSALTSEGATFGKKTGSGLGLWHAKQTLQAFGGDLEIASVVDKGTTVTLWIPSVVK